MAPSDNHDSATNGEQPFKESKEATGDTMQVEELADVEGNASGGEDPVAHSDTREETSHASGQNETAETTTSERPEEVRPDSDESEPSSETTESSDAKTPAENEQEQDSASASLDEAGPSGNPGRGHNGDEENGNGVEERKSDSTVRGATRRRKLTRTSYTKSEIQKLNQYYSERQYLSPESLEAIAEEMGHPESKIRVWFQNKRASTLGTRKPKGRADRARSSNSRPRGDSCPRSGLQNIPEENARSPMEQPAPPSRDGFILNFAHEPSPLVSPYPLPPPLSAFTQMTNPFPITTSGFTLYHYLTSTCRNENCPFGQNIDGVSETTCACRVLCYFPDLHSAGLLRQLHGQADGSSGCPAAAAAHHPSGVINHQAAQQGQAGPSGNPPPGADVFNMASCSAPRTHGHVEHRSEVDVSGSDVIFRAQEEQEEVEKEWEEKKEVAVEGVEENEAKKEMEEEEEVEMDEEEIIQVD